MGRLGGGATFGYADQEAKFEGELETGQAFPHDMYAAARSVLKRLCHDPRKQTPESWETSACQAARDGPSGIKRLMVSVVDSGAQITQHITVDRVSDLLAGILNPDPKARMGSLAAMLHAANTLPFFSPQHSLALRDGTGIVLAGGPVQSMEVAYRNHPDLQGKSMPPAVMLPQAGMGVGVQVRKALKKGDVAQVYGGEYIPRSDTGRLRRIYATRYGISAFGCKRIVGAFLCDAAPTAERTIEWMINNNNAGPFMNGRDAEGPDINCKLERHTAWLDNAGRVWFVLYANRDIAAGEWLMWRYNWRQGPGICTPGLTFSFD